MKRFFLITLFLFLVSVGNAETWYVRSSGGSDSNNGQTFSTAYASIQHAADVTTVSGSVILICNDGVHLPTSSVSWDTNLGSTISPIQIRGGSATGDDDGTIVTISGTSLPATTDLFTLSLSDMRLRFSNLILTSATQHNLLVTNSGFVQFFGCRFTGASSNGVHHNDSGSNAMYFIDCEFDSNGARGYSANSIARGRSVFNRCVFRDNTTDGCYESMSSVGSTRPDFDQCLFYGNGATGLTLIGTGNYGGMTVKRCTFFDNTTDGLNIDEDGGFIRYDSLIFRSNGSYGINTNTAVVSQFVASRICAHNNTSGNIDINGGVIPGDNIVLEDPQFVSEVTPDLTPGNANLLVAVILPAGSGSGSFEYFGAIQPEPVAGGGGGGPLVGPGRLAR